MAIGQENNVTKDKQKPLAAVQIDLDIEILSTREHVWTALVEKIDRWWPKGFYALENTEKFTFEPRLGGRMYEDAGNGAGILWYTVVGFDPPSNMSLAGHLVPPFAGPATTFLRLHLSQTGFRKTTLKITDSVFGVVGESAADSMRDGWKEVFDGGLKTYVESSE